MVYNVEINIHPNFADGNWDILKGGFNVSKDEAERVAELERKDEYHAQCKSIRVVEAPQRFKVQFNNHPTLGEIYWQDFSFTDNVPLTKDKADLLAKEVRADKWCPRDEAVKVVAI